MKPRTLIILGIVLAVVFVVGIGAGAGGGSGSKVNLDDIKNASWRSSLDQALTRKLDPANDMTLQAGSTPANCVVQPGRITIMAGASCVYQVGSTFIPLTRRLTLTILASDQVRFSLDQPDALPISNLTITGQKTSFDIYKSGGSFTMTCQSAPSGKCDMQVD